MGAKSSRSAANWNKAMSTHTAAMERNIAVMERALDADVERILSSRIRIKVFTETDQFEIDVAENDSVHGAISGALGPGASAPARASSCHSAHACC